MTKNNVHRPTHDPRSAQRPLGDPSVSDLHDTYARTRDPRIRSELIETHRGLVWFVANRYGRYGVDVEILFSYGVEGLMSAVDRFDPNKGFKFSTYAYQFISGHIRRGLDLELGGPQGRRLELERLDAPRRNDDGEHGTTLEEIQPDEHTPDPAATIASMLERRELADHILSLPADQRDVLVLRFGLRNEAPMTNDAIARSLGITGMKVRTLEARAIAHLRAVTAPRPAA
jgi:RNA polymerase sigma factor (sigma-70 family)